MSGQNNINFADFERFGIATVINAESVESLSHLGGTTRRLGRSVLAFEPRARFAQMLGATQTLRYFCPTSPPADNLHLIEIKIFSEWIVLVILKLRTSVIPFAFHNRVVLSVSTYER